MKPSREHIAIVVDDYEDDAAFNADLLRDLGWHHIETYTSLSALADRLDRPPAPSLIIADMYYVVPEDQAGPDDPVLHYAFDDLEAIALRHPSLRFLWISGKPLNELEFPAPPPDNVRVLTKPLHLDERYEYLEILTRAIFANRDSFPFPY